jgi:NEDD4-binding protein 2
MSFKIWLEKKEEKKLIIMRGISGSGKSTLAKKISEDGVVLSTDEFFMVNGKYDFNPEKLGLYHKKNQEKTEMFMKKGISPIVIDNTNSKTWEMKPYVQLADKYNYNITIKELPIPPMEELLKRQNNRKSINKSIPKEVLERMIDKFEKGITVNDIRRS